jgi:hypothetical protein
MDMGHRGGRIAAAIVVVGLVGTPAWAKTNYHSGIWNLLRDGGLCFAENGDSKVWPAGVITAGGKRYEIWRYAWEETPRTKTGSTEHANYKILIFQRMEKKLSFLGYYTVDGVPFVIRDKTIKFDYTHDDPDFSRDHLNGEIRFNEDGPPRTVVLDGEIRDLNLADAKVCTF